MSRFKSAHSCRLCGRWLEGEWARAVTDDERESIERQMNNGMCDDCQCQRKRQGAAMELIRAADQIRLAWQVAQQAYGPHAVDHVGQPLTNRSSLPLRRTETAEKRGVELGVWPERTWSRPARFFEGRADADGRHPC
jgi:hypothetical protein